MRAAQRGLRARLERRSALVDVLRITHSSLDPQKVSEFLVNWAPEWIPAPGWAVVSADPGRELTLLAERGLPGGLVSPVHNVAAWVVRYGTEFWSGSLAHDKRVRSTVPGSAIGFPLASRGRTIGALVGVDPNPGADPSMSPALLAGWRALLEPAAIALENALKLQRAEALSVTDDLTGLYNSRFLNQSLRRETKRATRSGRPLALLFIDLDGFKSVNDTHGHLHGSRALVEAAAVIKGSARETDVVARFGGDEFAVVLPETTAEGAWAVAERIRSRIAEHHFLGGEGLDVRLTVSIGVACLPDVARTAEELLQAADRAMYQIKSTGKNGTQLAAG
ncbi:MAG TPA: GGDEF domain-containing protein [Vicinamibacterales bacterium]|nr:GGDEF domain-containing protein [Vicinamibacterales bacterium]